MRGPNAKNNGAFVRLSVLKVRVAHNRARTTASLCAQSTGQLKFLWVLFCFGSLVCPADVFEPVSWCVRLLPSNQPLSLAAEGGKKVVHFQTVHGHEYDEKSSLTLAKHDICVLLPAASSHCQRTRGKQQSEK